MPVGSSQLGAPLDIPAPPKGASRLVPDDDALIEFADESGTDRKFSAAGEVEGGVVREFIVTGDEVRDTRSLFSDRRRRSDSPDFEITDEGSSRQGARYHFLIPAAGWLSASARGLSVSNASHLCLANARRGDANC